MKKHGLLRCAAAISAAIACCSVPANTHAKKPGQQKTSAVAPTIFGRVFEANRASLVRVQGRPSPDAWTTGFIIGAEGEVVFGAHKAPDQKLKIRTADGGELDGELLGYDLALSLAIGRISPASSPGSFTPLHVAAAPGLRERSWVVIMKHDARGRPEPFAGVVEDDPSGDGAPKSPTRVLVAPVLVPGAAGSPVLSADGELVGIALDDNARRTRVAAIESVVPFLKAVVLGRRSDR